MSGSQERPQNHPNQLSSSPSRSSSFSKPIQDVKLRKEMTVPPKELNFYKCIGTTYIDNKKFEQFGRPICFGIETKLKRSFEQKSLLRSFEPNKYENPKWTVDGLQRYRQERAELLASRHDIHDEMEETGDAFPFNQTNHSQSLSNETKTDEFTYSCNGRTFYALLENAKDVDTQDGIKYASSYSKTQPLTNQDFKKLLNISKPILISPPTCTPGFTVKTVNDDEKEYMIDLSILRIDFVSHERKSDMEDEEEETNMERQRQRQHQRQEQYKANLQKLQRQRREEEEDQQQQQHPENSLSQEDKEDEAEEERLERERLEKERQMLAEERQKQRERFFQEREKMFRDLKKERDEFLQKHGVRAKGRPNDRADEIEKDDDSLMNPFGRRPFSQQLDENTSTSPEPPVDPEAKKREREEAMKALWAQTKKREEQFFNFGIKTVENMKKITSAVATELQDEFPSRVYASSQRIVGQFGKTAERCQKTAITLYQYWTNDDDDDDDDGHEF